MPELRIDGMVYIWLALGILFLPLSWLLGAVLAALIHELCHFLAARFLGIRCRQLAVGTGGMVMHMEEMTRREEFWVALAGPLGSLSLAATLHCYPQLAVCGLVQGLYNLLPVYPLDGGRILVCLLGDLGRKIGMWVGWILGAAGLLFGLSLGFRPFLMAILMVFTWFRRKFPCNAAKLAVQ